jgi:predicted HAD superfamily hydrolase
MVARESPISTLLVAALTDLTDDHTPLIVSFDIFDTLLLRNRKCEARRFWEMAKLTRQRLAKKGIRPELSVEDLFTARYLSMRAGYSGDQYLRGCREAQILRVIGTQIELLNLPPEVEPLLLGLELDYEARNLVGNDVLLSAVQAAFGPVPLVGLSDMYLGAEHIESLVARVFEGRCRLTKIFSSADIVLNKRSGHAYSFVAEAMQVSSADILHIGDNIDTDLIQARLSGCKALPFPVTHAEIAARSRDFEAFLRDRRREGLDCDDYATL